MRRGPRGRRVFLCVVFAALGGLLPEQPSTQRPLRPFPEALSAAPAELVERLRADAFHVFPVINRGPRASARPSDVTDPAIVRLHGDAHVEQFAVTKDAWGLTDFDDSTRGPSTSISSVFSARWISPRVSAAGCASVTRSGTASRDIGGVCPIRMYALPNPASSANCVSRLPPRATRISPGRGPDAADGGRNTEVCQ